MPTPCERAARLINSRDGVRPRQRRTVHHVGRQHPFREVVDHLELTVAAGDGEIAHQRQVVQGLRESDQFQPQLSLDLGWPAGF